MVSRVEGPREAQAAVVALRSLDADTKKALNASVRSAVSPLWTGVVEANATSVMDSRVLAKGARVSVGLKPQLVAATSTRAMRGGLIPADNWQRWEFGSHRIGRSTYRTTSRKGRSYQATRHTQHQMPDRAKGGRVLYPAIAEAAPRILALWAKTTIRLVFDAYQRGV